MKPCLRNPRAQVPWMWIIIAIIIGMLILGIAFTLAGKSTALSQDILVMFGAD